MTAPTDAQSSPSLPRVLPPKALAHVVLRTNQFKPMVAFYTSFLGAHVTLQNEIMSFITYDDEHHRIAIVAVPGTSAKVRASSGLEHISFTFGSLRDLLTAYRQRKQVLGISPIWAVHHGPTMSIYYQDPDGNQIETQVDVFETAEEATACMQSEELRENPLGVDIDPEELIRRLDAGEDEKSLMKRPRTGPREMEGVPLMNPPAPDVRDVYVAQ